MTTDPHSPNHPTETFITPSPSSRAEQSEVEGPPHPGGGTKKGSLHSASRSLPRGHPRGPAPVGTTGTLADRLRIEAVETLSDDWYVLKKTTFHWRRSDGTWQRQSRETYDRGNG